MLLPGGQIGRDIGVWPDADAEKPKVENAMAVRGKTAIRARANNALYIL